MSAPSITPAIPALGSRLAAAVLIVAGAVSLPALLPGCGWRLEPRPVRPLTYSTAARLRNIPTGAIVSVGTGTDFVPSDRTFLACDSTGGESQALREWSRFIRTRLADAARPMSVAGGPWCLLPGSASVTAGTVIRMPSCPIESTGTEMELCPLPLPSCSLANTPPPGTPATALAPEARLEFDPLPVGVGSGLGLPVTVSNSGGGLLCLGTPQVRGTAADDFPLDASDCAPSAGTPAEVEAGRTALSGTTRPSCLLRVRFQPTAPGPRAAVLRVNTSDGLPHDIGLNGNGLAGSLSVTPIPLCLNVPPLAVGGLTCYTRTLRITNDGPGRVEIASVALPSEALADWTIVGWRPIPPTVRRNPGQTLEVDLRTCRADAPETVITIASDATNRLVELPLLPPASGCTP